MIQVKQKLVVKHNKSPMGASKGSIPYGNKIHVYCSCQVQLSVAIRVEMSCSIPKKREISVPLTQRKP